MKTEPRFIGSKINVIDPSSTEFNRGSFCYAPYLFYNGASEGGADVTIIESFRPEDIDLIPAADFNVISLWSYPQIETARMLSQFIPFDGDDNVYYVGYTPLIEELGLPHIEEIMGYDPLADSDFLEVAMRTYPKYYKDFGRLLLSDCDMHIKDLEKGEKVYPLFTTYGCSFGCAFCPSSTNCGRVRTILEPSEVFNMLDECREQGIRNIHFTDEDFFYDIDRAHSIMEHLAKHSGWHLIALASAKVFREYIEKYGSDMLRASGMEVIEIGFESAGDISSTMGAGKSLSDCEQLAQWQSELPVRIFWLVQTFFVGETIQSLNATGRFMKRYGLEMNEVVGRLRTNGTKGGLGQFFQGYHGTPIWKVMQKSGFKLTERPVRLMPSYIPASFLDSKIEKLRPELFNSAVPWLHLYSIWVPEFNLEMLAEGRTIRSYLQGKDPTQMIKLAMALAICARMEVIS